MHRHRSRTHLTLEKDVPWEQAPNGVIGLETALAAVYTHLVEPGLIGLSTAIERMTSGPAAAFGLETPTIRVGSPANLAVWDFGSEFLVEPPFRSRSLNCAFAGQRLRRRLLAHHRRRAHRSPHDRRGGGLMTSFLMLEDGTIHHGSAYAAEGVAVGELVFTTSMTGYQEVVTDPSFAGQLVTFTQPMIGNYGVEEDALRITPPHARGVVIREGRNPRQTIAADSRTGSKGMGWSGCRGSTLARSPGGCATAARCEPRSQTAITIRRGCLQLIRAAPEMAGQALAGSVSRPDAITLPSHATERAHVAVLDYGVKSSIVNLLRERGARVTVLPWDATTDQVLALAARRRPARERPRRPRGAERMRLPRCAD